MWDSICRQTINRIALHPSLCGVCNLLIINRNDDFQIHYSPVGQLEAAVAVVNSSMAMAFSLTELKKFVVYQIRILAYTSAGDGVISSPAVRVRTFEDGSFYCLFIIKPRLYLIYKSG